MKLTSNSLMPCSLALGDSSSFVARPVNLPRISGNRCKVHPFHTAFTSRLVVSPQLLLPRGQRFVCGLGGSSHRTLKVEAGCEERKFRDESRAVESVVPFSEEVTMGGMLDLEKQFSFYGSYHSNHVNVVIHMFFVWPIFYTSEILWAYTAPLAPLPLPGGTVPFQQYMVLNVSFFVASVYALYYIALDKKAGSLCAALCLGCWIGANAFAQAVSWSVGWKIALAAQLTCWIAQIYGHQKFEGRAPALMDNIAQAFLMAPFFVVLESLVHIGYEPYPGFRKAVQKNVDEAIREYRAKKAKKAA